MLRKVCDENGKKETKKDKKRWVLYTRLLEGSAHRTSPLKEEKKNGFIARDIESLFIEDTDHVA